MSKRRIGLTYCNIIGNSDRFTGHMKALDSYLKSTKTSQAQFAADVGVSQPTISDIIRGKHSPSVKLLKRIAKKTRLSVDKLLSGEAG
jgi:transcriptional regulator with XRE-family HTH domain